MLYSRTLIPLITNTVQTPHSTIAVRTNRILITTGGSLGKVYPTGSSAEGFCQHIYERLYENNKKDYIRNK